MNIQKAILLPLHDRVIVEPEKEKTETDSGMIIPDGQQEKPSRGVVIAAGPGLIGKPTEVRKGDTVLYQKNSGTPIEHDGKEYLLMPEGSIQAIVGRDEPFSPLTHHYKGIERESHIVSPHGESPQKPLFTIVLEEEVKNDEEGLVRIKPAEVYRSDVEKMKAGGILVSIRTGKSYRIDILCKKGNMFIQVADVAGCDVWIPSGENLVYYPPVPKEEEVEPFPGLDSDK